MRSELIISLMILLGCQPIVKKESQPTEKLPKTTQISEVVDKKDFSYYRPSNVKLKSPYFILIDPHADGKLACESFKTVAEKLGYIAVGLNNVENNLPDYLQRILKDIDEIKSTFKSNEPPIFIGGFSGGARMAFQSAQKAGIHSVIMCGAGVGNNIPTSTDFKLACISGYRDFNFIEQYYSPYSGMVDLKNYISLFFEGNHQYPPEDVLLQAAEFVLNQYSGDFNYRNKINEAEVKKANNQLLEGFKILELAYKSSPIEESGNYKIALGQYINSPEFKDFIRNFENILMLEQSRNQNYVKNLSARNKDWWKEEKRNMDKHIIDDPDLIISNSYFRSKAFMGILLFSRCNYMVRSKNLKNAEQLLKLYFLFEPENADAFYLKALLDHFQGNNKEAKLNLSKAFDYGFSDSLKLNADFPKQFILASKK